MDLVVQVFLIRKRLSFANSELAINFMKDIKCLIVETTLHTSQFDRALLLSKCGSQIHKIVPSIRTPSNCFCKTICKFF